MVFLFSRVKNVHTAPLRARFTISLRQRKPSFGVKIVLSGFTNDTQKIIIMLKGRGQLFVHLILLNMHL